jgi:hypothetical protein
MVAPPNEMINFLFKILLEVIEFFKIIKGNKVNFFAAILTKNKPPKTTAIKKIPPFDLTLFIHLYLCVSER